MEFLAFIMEHALILIPVLNVLGLIFKKTEKVPDKFIPLILLGFGILGAFAVLGFSADAAVQGVLVTGVAVYGEQVVKQLKKGSQSTAAASTDSPADSSAGAAAAQADTTTE